VILILALATVLATATPAAPPAPASAAPPAAASGFGATIGSPRRDFPRPVEATAAAPRDTSIRVPGSSLRLGWSHERTSVLGSFKEESNAGETAVRRGNVRWFGATAQATLTYRAGRLAVVRLQCTEATPALASYVPDELRREGYRRVSDVIESGAETTEWLGPGRVTLSASGKSLIASVASRETVRAEAATPGAASANDSTPASAATGTNTPVGTATPGAGSIAATPTKVSPVATPRATTSAAHTDSLPVGALPGEIDFTAASRKDSLPPPRIASTPPPPVRPRIAVDAGVFGRVLVRARVDTSGRVVHAEIARGIAEFNSAALAWASDVRFDPYLVNGRPAPVVVTIPVVFARMDSTPARPNP